MLSKKAHSPGLHPILRCKMSDVFSRKRVSEQSTFDGVRGCMVTNVKMICICVLPIKKVLRASFALMTTPSQHHVISLKIFQVPPNLAFPENIFHQATLNHLQNIGLGSGVHEKNPISTLESPSVMKRMSKTHWIWSGGNIVFSFGGACTL